MPCPTCSHTMQNLGTEGRRVFWCPRCGTLREYTGEDFSRVELPGWLRHVLAVAGLKPPAQNTAQHTQVSAAFKIDQFDRDAPRVELHVFDHLGRRVV